jgi:hypothetical protein
MAWTRLLFVALIGTSFSSAETITLTESAIATGSLNGNGFTDALLTLTASGDTSNVVNNVSGLFNLPNLTVSLNIAGVGTATVTSGGHFFSNENTDIVGFGGGGEIGGNEEGGLTILGQADSAFGSYNLATSIGPITDSSLVDSNETFNTSAGGLLINSAGDATFTATVSSPEPSTTLLFGFGLAALTTLKSTVTFVKSASS